MTTIFERAQQGEASWTEWLADVSVAELRKMGDTADEIEAAVDAQAAVDGLRLTGSVRQAVRERLASAKAAAALGRKGGKASTPAKAAAARANGGKGGRPCYAFEVDADAQGGGHLWEFASAATRDGWVAGRDTRRAVTARTLPAGWDLSDANQWRG